jgi:hypothetical protein
VVEAARQSSGRGSVRIGFNAVDQSGFPEEDRGLPQVPPDDMGWKFHSLGDFPNRAECKPESDDAAEIRLSAHGCKQSVSVLDQNSRVFTRKIDKIFNRRSGSHCDLQQSEEENGLVRQRDGLPAGEPCQSFRRLPRRVPGQPQSLLLYKHLFDFSSPSSFTTGTIGTVHRVRKTRPPNMGQ